MRILVTGGTGFIGAHVVRQLTAQAGVETTLLVRPSSDLWRLRAAGVLPESGRVQLIQADLTDAKQIRAALRRARPEVIVHLGALVYYHFGPAGAADVHAVNFQATVALFEAFAGAGRRFISAGSCFEYGPNDGVQLEEATTCRPVYDYAVAKLKATDAVLTRGQATATEALVLRIFSPHGPLEDLQRVVPQLLMAGLQGRRLALTPGQQVRDYVTVEDVASAFVQAALQPRLARAQAIYNVCAGTAHSLRELAQAAADVLDRSLDLEWGKLPYRPNELMRLVGSNRRIQEDLGWQPVSTLEQGLRRSADWWRAVLAGCQESGQLRAA